MEISRPHFGSAIGRTSNIAGESTVLPQLAQCCHSAATNPLDSGKICEWLRNFE